MARGSACTSCSELCANTGAQSGWSLCLAREAASRSRFRRNHLLIRHRTPEQIQQTRWSGGAIHDQPARYSGAESPLDKDVLSHSGRRSCSCSYQTSLYLQCFPVARLRLGVAVQSDETLALALPWVPTLNTSHAVGRFRPVGQLGELPFTAVGTAVSRSSDSQGVEP